MSKPLYISNARIVTPSEVINSGSLIIEDGRIAVMNPESVSSQCQEHNVNGAYLIPGLIDLHGDAIEKMIEPRPGVLFPLEYSLRAMDRQLMSTGITTVYHALSFAGEELGVRNIELACEILRKIQNLKEVLSLDTRVHCRYEVTRFESLPLLQKLIEAGCVDQLSLMDHTPGQGQFKSDESYETYLVKAYKNSPQDAKRMIAEKKSRRDEADHHMRELAEVCQTSKVILASHDDDSAERVDLMRSLGVRISEFPLDLDTAKKAREEGLYTVFGSPNVVRGKSQSQGMRAQDAIEAGLADCLCSDYKHAAMLSAVFILFEKGILSLPEAVKLVSANPAKAINEPDLGSIETGKIANLVAVEWDHSFPTVRGVWINGEAKLIA